LGPCEQLAKALQNISYTAIGAKHSSELLIKTLTLLRNNDFFNDTWNKTKQLAVHLNLTMSQNPRVCKPPVKLEYYNNNNISLLRK
jgi:hypothetical protein